MMGVLAGRTSATQENQPQVTTKRTLSRTGHSDRGASFRVIGRGVNSHRSKSTGYGDADARPPVSMADRFWFDQ